jgi:transposase
MMGILGKYSHQALLIYITYEFIKHKNKWYWSFGQPVLRHTRINQNFVLFSSVIVSEISPLDQTRKICILDISLINLLILVIGITFIWLSHPNLNQFSLTRMPRPETMKLVRIENLIYSAQIFGVYCLH